MVVMTLVKNVMSKPVITVSTDATVQAGAGLMRDSRIGCLVVTDPKGEIKGIVTETDIIRKVVADGGPLTRHIKDVMTTDVKTISEDEEVDKAARIMAAHVIRKLPVLNKSKELVGLITLKDVVKNKRVDDESEYYPYFS